MTETPRTLAADVRDVNPLPEGRWCAYAQAGITSPGRPDLHMVAYITEGEPGYFGTTYTGTLDYCKAVAESINKSIDVDTERRDNIVASSMAAGFAGRA